MCATCGCGQPDDAVKIEKHGGLKFSLRQEIDHRHNANHHHHDVGQIQIDIEKMCFSRTTSLPSATVDF